jgi:peroxiredoxin
MSVELNQKAPNFKLFGTDKKEVELASFAGKKVVVAFFPAAFTGVCERELCTFRDSLSALGDLNATVLAISVDGPFSNKAFAERNALTFPVLSDYARAATSAYGVALENFAGMPGYVASQRAVFVVNEEGVLTYKWIAPNPGVEPNYDEVKAALA